MSIADQVRQSQGRSETVSTELITKSDADIDAAWQKVALGLGRGEPSDYLVNVLETDGWSYDSAYWLTTQVRLFGNGGPRNARSLRKPANIISAVIILAPALLLAAFAVSAGRLPFQAMAIGAGMGAMIVAPIRFIFHRQLR